MRGATGFWSGLLAVVCGLLPGNLLAQSQQVRVNLSTAEYEAAIAQARESESEWSPVQVTAFEQRDETRYSIVLERGNALPWIEKHLLTPQEFQDQFDAYLGQGFRPVSVALSQVDEQPRLTAIWQKRGEPGWQLSTGVSEPEFSDLAETYRTRSLHPASVSGIEVEGRVEFVVLWEAGPAETEAALSIDPAKFRDESAAREKQGFAPRSVQAYRSNGKSQLAVVWDKQPKTAATTEVRALASQNELNDLIESQRNGRFTIQSLSSTLIDGRPAYSVILKPNGR